PLGGPAGLYRDLELGERVDGESVVQLEELLGLLCLRQALIAPALDLLVVPRAQPPLQRLDAMLPIDEVEPLATVADHRSAHLLRVETGRELVHPGLVQVPLGQRVDPHPGQRHPPQPGRTLDPARRLAVEPAARPAVASHPQLWFAAAAHLVTSLSWRANLASARSDPARDAHHPGTSAGSISAGAARPPPL